MPATLATAQSGGLVVVVKNTFLEVSEDSDSDSSSTLVRRSRVRTLPCDFGSKWHMLEGVSRDDDDSMCSEVDTISASSSLPSLVGRMWSMSQDPHSCRTVQEVLGDELLENNHREALAQELCGHVLEAAVCPYANFVLQKCIGALRPEAAQFIIEEIPAESVSAVAQNKFGCRVLQRLFERCHSCQVQELVEAILADFTAIAQSPYGNYVVQNLLECRGADTKQRQRFAQLIEGTVGELGPHPYGCIVLSTALSKCSVESRMAIARAILAESGLLRVLARTRHGHRTVLVLLGFLEGVDYHLALHLLSTDETLVANKFGRVVLAQLKQS